MATNAETAAALQAAVNAAIQQARDLKAQPALSTTTIDEYLDVIIVLLSDVLLFLLSLV